MLKMLVTNESDIIYADPMVMPMTTTAFQQKSRKHHKLQSTEATKKHMKKVKPVSIKDDSIH